MTQTPVTFEQQAPDRSLAFGDGVFTTFVISGDRVVLRDAHQARLLAACHALGIDVDAAQIDAALEACVAQYQLQKAKLGMQAVGKLIISAGHGGRGYARLPVDSLLELPSEPFSESQSPSHHANAPQFYGHLRALVPLADNVSSACDVSETLTVGISDVALGRCDDFAGHKTTNALPYVLAAERKPQLLDEMLLCDYDGHLVEAIANNVFVLTGRTLWAPDVSQCGVAGVCRAWLMSQAQTLGLNVDVSAKSLSTVLAEVERIDGLWLTNAVHGLREVSQIVGVQAEPLAIRTGSDVAQTLIEKWHALKA